MALQYRTKEQLYINFVKPEIKPLVDFNDVVIKAYWNGNFFVGSRYFRLKNNKFVNNDDEVVNMKNYISEQRYNEGQPSKVRYHLPKDEMVVLCYKDILGRKITMEDRVLYVKETALKNYGYDFNDNFTPGRYKTCDEYIQDQIHRINRSIHDRIQLFNKKAFANNWNYFVTLTYDDKKIVSEEEFIKKVKSILSLCHSRLGWLYQGVIEHGKKTQRAHFHLLLYIPDGCMKGKLVKKTAFNAKKKIQMQRIENTYFFERFGINEFEKINPSASSYITVLNRYICKYVTKDLENFYYSRGIQSDVYFKENRNTDYMILSDLGSQNKPYTYIFDNDEINPKNVVKVSTQSMKLVVSVPKVFYAFRN